MIRYSEANGLEKTNLSENHFFKKIVHMGLYLPIAFFVPISILVYTNIYLILMLKTKYEMTKRLSQTMGYSLTKLDNKEENKKEPLLALADAATGDNGTKFLGIEMLSITFSRKNSIVSDDVSHISHVSRASPPLSPKSTLKVRKSKHTNVTIMLVAVVTFFLICQVNLLDFLISIVCY